MKKKIIVICNGNEVVGFGHLSRCLNIIENFNAHYSGYLFSFLGLYSEDALLMIERCSTDYKIEIKLISDIDNSCLLIDDYLMTQEALDALTNNNKVLIVDDFNLLNYKDCSLVINFRSQADLYQYNAKNLALGIEFFPAPLSFIDIKKHQIKKTLTEIENILVFIGGNDQNNIGLKVSKRLAKIFPRAVINFVSRLEINTKEIEFNNIKVYCVQPVLDSLLLDADIVVSGGGLLKYESIYCAIPNYAINQTHEQELDTNILESQGLTIDLGMSESYSNGVDRIAKDFKNFPKIDKIKQRLALGIPENSGQKLSNKIDIAINE